MDPAECRANGATRAMSSAQRRLWFLEQLRPASADYLLPSALRLRGKLDLAALRAALTTVVARHEVLRTQYTPVGGEPLAQVADESAVSIESIDATGADDAAIAELLARELARPIDLSVAPVLRASLARLGEDDHLLMIVVHHIAFDFTSWTVLSRELAAAYRAHAEGRPLDLAPLTLQYGDYAAGEQERLGSARAARGLAHWRSRLAGLGPLELPTDRARPAEWDGAAATARFVLPAELVAEVDRFARARRATRFMVLLAAFQALLGRYSGQSDFAVGTPVAGRAGTGISTLIGLFVNTLTLRADLSGRPGFGELVQRVRDAALSDFSHADTPFERVVTELAPERDLARNPLFQVSFLLLDAPAEPPAFPGLEVRQLSTPSAGTPFDLVLDLLGRVDGGLFGRLQYATALFDEDTVVQLAAGYATVLRELLAAPEEPVAEITGRLAPLPGRERARLLGRGVGEQRDVPDLTVVDLFEERVSLSPRAIAVRSGIEELDYAELDARANRLAHRLRALGVGPGVRVGVYLRRGVGLPVALLAVFKADGVYVPLDPIHPAQRINTLIMSTGIAVTVSESALAADLDATTGGPNLVLLDRADELAALPAEPPARVGGPRHLAYIFHTSGSTGAPKGVLIPHRGLVNILRSMGRRFDLGADSVILAVSTVSFDPSMLELCLPLLLGAQVLIADTEQARDPERLVRLLAAARPDLIQATPTVLRMLADVGWIPAPGLAVLSGGEKLSADLIRTLAADGATVWDLYGPTESSIWTSTARHAADGSMSRWDAVENTTVRVLDERFEPVPVGGVGEIHLGGAGVGWGYDARPGQSADVFRPDPHATVPGARMYATGDLGRLCPDGSVEILGRRDHQVKIRGHRIEPGEIEAALRALDGIRAAAVHATPDGAGGFQLTAYLVPDLGAVPENADALRALLLRSLPDYMVPAAFVVLDELPRTASGKVDRGALPLPTPSQGAAATAISPRTPEERAVAEVWQEVLGIEGVGAEDDFFRLGGHSLLATRVAVRLRAALGVDVPVRALFDHTTVAALAAALARFPRLSATPLPRLTARRRPAEPVYGGAQR